MERFFVLVFQFLLFKISIYLVKVTVESLEFNERRDLHSSYIQYVKYVNIN